LGILGVSLLSCRSENAKEVKYQFVRVFTDYKGAFDEEIILKFEKESGIDVHFIHLSSDSLLSKLTTQKYSSGVDLIIFSNAQTIPRFLPYFSRLDEKNIENLDKSYISASEKWLTLAKSPVVLCANKQLIDPKSLKYFADLKNSRLQGLLTVSQYGTPSLDVFERSYRELRVRDVDSFFVHFYRNRYMVKGDDFEQLKLIKTGTKAIGIIELSYYLAAKEKVKKDSLSQREFSNLQVILPAQNKKGTIYNIHGAGIYRYAENRNNAAKLLYFLSSKSAQYKFAAGRNSFPISQGVDVNYHLQAYKRLRGRFYKTAFE
jgi:iron(III) transport system substrate-binding protein